LSDKVIFDFSKSGDVDVWYALNDTVMGGHSESRMVVAAEGTAAFIGVVSLENYGGFASVRTKSHPYDLSTYGGIELRVRGDGKHYDLNLYGGGNFDGVNYRKGFATLSNEWISVRIPFADLVPTYRGAVLRDVPRLNTSNITQFGLMISDHQAGSFRLELASIKAYH
jgi:NADH dehydrogenase [ubiquinone] 1 alpha subcomplex assembly factor 1